jgi:uncharacterized protein YjbI with pentapeptide repeats
MKTYTKEEIESILESHLKWLDGNVDGVRANLSGADLSRANLSGADLSGADLSRADLSRADLSGADLSRANLSVANLSWANLSQAKLSRANLSWANLSWANLSVAKLSWANLSQAKLSRANLSGANLSGADLSDAKNMVKIIGVESENYYWKAIGDGLINENYQFKLGINKLRKDEIFADDERVLCSYPGFHFASKSWCKVNYGSRPYLCKIRLPKGCKINEPWATDGKASADMIEIVQIFDMNTEEDITKQFK